MENPEAAIEVSNVSKNFLLPHERAHTLKSAFTSVLKGKKTKTVEKQRALKDINFQIQQGEFFGIVGRNGSGKSTLLKILAGIYQPSSGTVTVRGRIIPFIELGVGFNSELTGRENVYLSASLIGFSKKEIDSMYHDIVAFAELEKFMDQKLKNYSSGMQVRLAFSIATRAEGDILLVDEVLAVGDADFQRKCFNHFKKLKKEKKTVVFVSHDMAAVREYCDRAVLIEKSELVLEGNTDKVATAYTRMFMDADNKTAEDLKSGKKRWGNKKVTIEKPQLEKKTLKVEDKTLVITHKLKATETLERPVAGYLIKNASGTQLMGTNNKLKQQPIKKIEAGETVAVEWRVPNIFNDGTYTIDIAVSEDNGATCDWWEDALSFKCYKEEYSAYIVMPDTRFSLKK